MRNFVGVLAVGCLLALCSIASGESLKNKAANGVDISWSQIMPDYSCFGARTRELLSKVRHSALLSRAGVEDRLRLLRHSRRSCNLMLTPPLGIPEWRFRSGCLSVSCPQCGRRTVYFSCGSSLSRLNDYIQPIRWIRYARPGLDIVLDTTFLCPACNPEVLKRTELGSKCTNLTFLGVMGMFIDFLPRTTQDYETHRDVFDMGLDIRLWKKLTPKDIERSITMLNSSLVVKKEFADKWPRDEDWFLLVRYPGEKKCCRLPCGMRRLDLLLAFVNGAMVLRGYGDRDSQLQDHEDELREILGLNMDW